MWRSVQQNGGISGEREHKVDDFCGLRMIQHPLDRMSGGILFSPCQKTVRDEQKNKNQQQKQYADTARLQWPQYKYKTMNIIIITLLKCLFKSSSAKNVVTFFFLQL